MGRCGVIVVVTVMIVPSLEGTIMGWWFPVGDIDMGTCMGIRFHVTIVAGAGTLLISCFA